MHLRKFLAVSLLLPALAVAADLRSFDLPVKWFGAMPALEVSVNGRGPYLFALDTGASGAVEPTRRSSRNCPSPSSARPAAVTMKAHVK